MYILSQIIYVITATVLVEEPVNEDNATVMMAM